MNKVLRLDVEMSSVLDFVWEMFSHSYSQEKLRKRIKDLTAELEALYLDESDEDHQIQPDSSYISNKDFFLRQGEPSALALSSISEANPFQAE